MSSDSCKPCGRVLLVDDHTQLRHMLGLALQLSGFEVREAATPAEAFYWLATDQPAISPTDQHGLSMLRALRECPTLEAVPLVFLAAERNEELHWQALASGADWFTYKPLSLRELQEHVADMVQRGRPRLRSRTTSASRRLVS